MRAVIQRVSRAQVFVDAEAIAGIGPGLLILLGVGKDDVEDDCEYLAAKTAGLRIFEDAAGKMNLSARDAGAQALVVSQFTLYGDVRRGRRPSFDEAALPEHARLLYEYFVKQLRATGMEVQTGRFGANMQVESVNDGPVTILIDSKRLF